MPHRGRRWFLWALGLSLALHILTIGGDTITMLAGMFTGSGEQVKLRKPSKELAGQTLDDEPEKPAGLAGVKPADNLSITFQQPRTTGQVQSASATHPATPQSKKKLAAASRASHVASQVVAEVGKEAAARVAAQVNPLASNVAIASIASVAQPVASTPHVAMASAAASMPQAEMVAATKQFPRNVSITYYWGGTPATMTWHVERGEYVVSLQFNALGKREFRSEGKINNNGVVPMHWISLLNGEKQTEGIYDWDAKTITLDNKGDIKTEPLKEGAQDFLSAALQFSFKGANAQRFKQTLISGKKVYEDIPFEILGEATLYVSTKPVNATLLHGHYEDRVVDFWLATDWHSLPVRIKASFSGIGIDIQASEIRIGDKTVLSPSVLQRDPRRRGP
ncbi:DUF3108 domain-containing protein [Andreprevotia chitinilytica]|uniref:DUF3108 domain-containing protein n=1 Tax=Andreprevotia chitinilytica TaxID=396808 RepID=UPI000557A6EC|nr:DUF3108 domain-containing protein [Andreprevotia chitinilytica]